MDLGLRDRVALVAAGSKGLGRAIARELAAEGAQVVICARGKDALDATVAEIVGAGGRAFGFVADVAKPDDVARLVESARSTCGPIDILVTNSGGPRSGTFDVLSPEDWDQATRVLLTSAVELTRAVMPDMRARRWGRILNITSIAAKQPVDGLMLSNSLRAAVTAFARTLANEVAPHGITVNNLLPGYTRTDRVVDLAAQMAASSGTSPEAVAGKWEAQIPMGRLGEPREFAALAAFLASDRASYITGQSIAVDGGWIRGLM
ncbi:MAG: SDR family oxidoreductase [Acidobacteria bacterium]|jgi:3-oxoacyl-[acyl-carrier protein] reductase|nr:SDR family oxidoreductase [Acidobacteriota bacterium]